MNRIDINPITKTVTISYGFSESLKPYYKYMKHVTKIVFENKSETTNVHAYYLHPITLESSPNITVLILKNDSNCPLTLNNSITTLILGNSFNRDLILTYNLTTIVFGGYAKDIQLTKNITHATFGDTFNCCVELNKNIKHIVFGQKYCKETFLTKNITYVHFGRLYTKITVLPKAITHVLFDSQVQIKTLTKNIVHLRMHASSNKLAKKIKHLEICSVNLFVILQLPKHLTHLKISNVRINYLTPYVKHLDVLCCHSIVLEHGKTQMFVRDRATHIPSYILENLPNNVIGVSVANHAMETYIKNLPSSVKGFNIPLVQN